jgi:hypothetical protein
MDRANQNFYQQSTKFTELFEKVAGLNQRKQMQEQNLAALKKHIKLLKGEKNRFGCRFRRPRFFLGLGLRLSRIHPLCLDRDR